MTPVKISKKGSFRARTCERLERHVYGNSVLALNSTQRDSQENTSYFADPLGRAGVGDATLAAQRLEWHKHILQELQS